MCSSPIKHNVALTVTSVLAILFTTFHLADDYSRGFSPGGLTNIPVPFVLAVWLYAALVLVERRSGHVILLVFSLLASGLPIIHMTGRSGLTGGAIAKSAGAVFFSWTLLAVGITAVCAFILSLRGLWSLRRGQPK